MEYSCSGSSKRPKPPTTRNDNIIRCSVDGCNSDLSKCREYHRRHKVCELHSKTPMVTVGGRELRFCQQCSRFQSLVEFDEGKRSCRKRLEGHNRRRRKPHPDSISENSGLILPSQQGSRLLSFNSQPQPIIHGAEETAVNYMHPFLAGFSTQSFKEKVFSGGLNEAENSNNNNNNGARSLLSSATSQPLIYSGLHYGGGNSESDGGGLNQYGSTQQVENKPFVFPAAGGADDDGTHNTTTTGLHFQNPTATGSLTFRWE